MPAEVDPLRARLAAARRRLAPLLFSAVVAVVAAGRVQRAAGVARGAADLERDALARAAAPSAAASAATARPQPAGGRPADARRWCCWRPRASPCAAPTRCATDPRATSPRGVLAFDVTLAEARYSEPEQRRRFVREVEPRLADAAGRQRASRSPTRMPGRGGYSSRQIEVEGQPRRERRRAAPGRGAQRDARALRHPAPAARRGARARGVRRRGRAGGGRGEPEAGRALLAGRRTRSASASAWRATAPTRPGSPWSGCRATWSTSG